MPFDGNGVFVYTSTTVTPAVSATTIDSAEFNTFTADVSTALTSCLTKTGESTPTANLPMGGFRHTGCGTALAGDEYCRVSNVQAQTYTWDATDTGAADAYAIQPFVAITSYIAGQRFSFIPANDNTGASTITVSGLASKSIKLMDGTDPAAGDIDATGVCEVIYNGTAFGLLNPATVVRRTATQTLTNKTLNGGAITTHSSSPFAATSGTEVDVTGIPAWAKRINITLHNVSSDVADGLELLIGDSGGLELTGYFRMSSFITSAGAADTNANPSTDHFNAGGTSADADILSGVITLSLVDSSNNTWAQNGHIANNNATTDAAYFVAGSKSLSGVLTQLRLNWGGGNSFDGSGVIGVTYEG